MTVPAMALLCLGAALGFGMAGMALEGDTASAIGFAHIGTLTFTGFALLYVLGSPLEQLYEWAQRRGVVGGDAS